MKRVNLNLRSMTAIAVSLAVTVMFASCKKGSDNFNNSDINVIIANNMEESENVVKIQAIVSDTQWSKQVISETFLKDNGFQLFLPNKLSENLLKPIVNENLPKNLVSDSSAKWAFLGFDVESANSSLYHILILDNSHSQPDGKHTKEGIYVYADRPVRLSGNNVRWEDNPRQPWSSLLYQYEVESTTTYSNLTLTAGWNVICKEYYNEIVSDKLRRAYFTYSNKDLSDCKWRFYIHDFTGY